MRARKCEELGQYIVTDPEIFGRAGMKDRGEIIPLLHTLRRPTFFTRDHDFYKADLCHRGYCLVFLDVAFDEAADFIRRILRHTAFRTQAQRIGRVVRVHHSGVSYWQRESKRPTLSGGDSLASVGWHGRFLQGYSLTYTTRRSAVP